MEALFFLFNAIAVVILVITSLKNDQRKPDEPMVGPYRFIDTLTPPKPKRRPAAYLNQDNARQNPNAS